MQNSRLRDKASGKGDRIRADTVGSLLRPDSIHQARARHQAGKIDDAALRAVEDAAIADVIALQERIGLRVVTDGEFRRENWWIDFVRHLTGVAILDGETTAFSHDHGKPSDYVPKTVKTVGKLGVENPVLVDDFRFVASRAREMAKITIPSPTRMHFHGGRKVVSEAAYPDIEEFFADLADVYRREIAALEEAGCRYIQIDDPLLTYFLDPTLREEVRADGDDPDARLGRYVRLINACISARRPGTTIGIHLCRGNARSNWIAEGTYEGLAEACFGGLQVDRFLLEYDDERSGSFAPLRFMPKGKEVVLGLVTTKRARLENKDDLKRRLDEATKYVDGDDLAISPQCGFASVVEGNLITLDDEIAKLGLVVDTAREFWGRA
ncbi:MAG TPA: 5-methyltetrahydropteroyltriglutamate--homocysteine S-methyltransferase [Rhodoblastus sp.]|nr:5-methyltetrahydropteroyltriglutamate--homocysteine S-methyltransferase [Rhodoblastus sp.]